MKKRIKKVIAIILTVATVMTMFITPTFAASITSGAKGSDYTARRSLAKKLDEVFAGNVEIYSDAKCTKRITSTLGTSYLTYSNLGYAGSASHHSYRGSTCWLYLNGVYYHLFSEVVNNGTPEKNSYKLNISGRSSYDNFKRWGVRNEPGAAVRSNGHSFMLLKYDSWGVYILEGNGNDKGLVRIRTLSWTEFSGAYGSIEYIIQPKQEYFDKMYPTAPKITKQPDNITVKTGSTATFTVAATTTKGKIEYEWQVNDGKGWKNVYKKTDTSFTSVTEKATMSKNGYQYRCIITGEGGVSTTRTVTLTVCEKPSIKSQTKSQKINEGASLTLSVSAKGNALGYTWQSSKDNKTWTNCASGSSMKITGTKAASKIYYRCVVKNVAGTTTGNSICITVRLKPTVKVGPSSVKVAKGKTAKFTVQASGESLKYQWQVSTNNGRSWSNYTGSGANKASISVKATKTMNGYMYRCIVSNPAGSITTNAATLSIK